MSKTLSLNRRTHLFIKDDALYIKLQNPAPPTQPMRPDFYIVKKFELERLKEIRDWADAIIKDSESSNGKTD